MNAPKFSKIIFLLLFIFSIYPGLCFAKSYNGYPINNIIIQSSDLSQAYQLRQYLNKKLGGYYSDPIINEFIKDVYKNNRLENINIFIEEEFGGISLILKLYDKFFVSNIVINGNESFLDEKIYKIINVKKHAEITNINEDEIIMNLQKFYKNNGFFDASINVEFIKIPDVQGVPIHINILEKNRIKISNIRFVGFTDIKLGTLVNKLGIKTGSYFNKNKIDRGIERLNKYLYKKDYLSASVSRPIIKIDRDNSSCQITIIGKIGNKIDIKFHGNNKFWDKELKKKINIKEIKSFTDISIKNTALSLVNIYKDNGYHYIKVEPQLIKQKEKVKIKFIIDEGRLVKVVNFKFLGNSNISEINLNKTIFKQIKAGKLKKVYSTSVLDAAISAVINYYNSKGFLNANAKIAKTHFKRKDSVSVEIEVSEGPRTIIRNLKILGNNVFLTKTLLEILPIKEEAPLNYINIAESKRLILQNYYREGFLNCEIIDKVFITADKKDSTVEFAVFENKQSLVGNISIKGNFRTNDEIIRQEITLDYGMPLNAEEIFNTQKNLQALGIFRSVSIKDKGTISGTNFHNIEIEVVEANAIILEFGAGYGSFTESNQYFKDNVIRGFAGISHKNLLGGRERVSLKAELSRRLPTAEFFERKIIFGIMKPNILNWHLDTSLNYVHKKEDRIAFDVHENSITFNVDKELIKHVISSFQYIFEFVDTFNAVQEEENRLLRLGAFGFIYNVTGTNKRYNPTMGILSNAKLHVFNKYFASESDFAKIILRNEIFFPFFKYLTWHLSLRGGYGFSYGRSSSIPIEERFFLGGTFSVRGFSEDKVGSNATFTDDGDPLGGNIFINYTAELIFPIYNNFKGAVFTDGGNVYANNADFDFIDQRNSAGFGVRYNTPIGPLKLDYGLKLDKQDGERIWAIHFAVGIF